MTDQDTIWIADIEQDIGKPITVPCTSRGVARVESERIASDIGDPIESWIEDWGEGQSEWGSMESGRKVIIRRASLVDSPRESDSEAALDPSSSSK